jgi:hypothetical protein
MQHIATFDRKPLWNMGCKAKMIKQENHENTPKMPLKQAYNLVQIRVKKRLN